jgi:hypothetical protein
MNTEAHRCKPLCPARITVAEYRRLIGKEAS